MVKYSQARIAAAGHVSRGRKRKTQGLNLSLSRKQEDRPKAASCRHTSNA